MATALNKFGNKWWLRLLQFYEWVVTTALYKCMYEWWLRLCTNVRISVGYGCVKIYIHEWAVTTALFICAHMWTTLWRWRGGEWNLYMRKSWSRVQYYAHTIDTRVDRSIFRCVTHITHFNKGQKDATWFIVILLNY